MSMVFAALLLSLAAADGWAETYPRISAAEGTVIAHKSGEEAKFVDLPVWRAVDVNQDLLAGDTLRTNANGNLSIRFADMTLVRMGRNTTLIVKKIDSVDESVLGLTEGSVWARAVRGGSRLQIDTPAAAAAIRGTDWTLRVSGGQTTLTVLEGAVELKNAHGAVLVRQGEGATATLGQAPRKYTLVNLREREQMLLYTELRGVFSDLPATGMNGPRSRAERRRMLAVAPEKRTADDWLTLAETSLLLTGREDTRKALAHLRRPLSRRDEARATLVRAMLAGLDLNYAEAARLFAAALPALPHDRKAVAAYGLWFARSLAEPDKSVPPPSQAAYADDAVSALARAKAVAHLNGQAEAIDVLVAAEKRFPGDARLAAMHAALAMELDRRDEVKAALDRAGRLDPDEPTYLLVLGRYKATIPSDLHGALADLQHAAAVAPGADDVWNEIGLVQGDRNAIVEARAAYVRAITLNPENAALHANYARFLMDNDQVLAAKHEIDAAQALDPHSYAVLAAKGRYLLRIGKPAEGEKALLEASALNPTYGDALIGLAIASYQQAADDEAMQALDNANRFDPDNPSVPLVKAGIAVDQFEADEAIAQAREALRRSQQRGGVYTGYDANRQPASYLGVTLENLGMDEWRQYYAARAYDPFKSSTYFDEADGGRLTPFVGLPPSGLERFPSSITTEISNLQGLLMDPLAVASEQKRNSLETRSFFEASLMGSVLDQGTGLGPGGSVLLQETSYTGLPMSCYLQGNADQSKGLRNNDFDNFDQARFQLGIRPTLTDKVVLFGNKFRGDEGFPGFLSGPTPLDNQQTDSSVLGGAWSHTIGDRNVVQVLAVASDITTREQILDDDPYFSSLGNFKYANRYRVFGVGHILGIGPATLRYGVEGVDYDSVVLATHTFDPGYVYVEDPFRQQIFAARSYADLLLDVTNDLKIEAGAYAVHMDDVEMRWGPVDPRLGVAWSPISNHWLRAFYRQDTQMPVTYTLSPISTVGLAPMDLPLVFGGQERTAALRWDAEWNERLFTAVEYQHVRFSGLSLSIEDLLADFPTPDGAIDQLNFSSNYWIGHGLGAFGSVTLNRSKDFTPGFEGGKAPLVPDHVAQVGLKYVSPSRITATIAQNWVGHRDSPGFNDGASGAFKLDAYTTTDAALTWTSENRAVDWGLAVTNVFDHRIESSADIPAPGRTIRATFTARF
jgi:Tfp pilus assembly protein PilF